MKNLKPSQLPEGTVIDGEKHGEYIKRANGIWEELDSDMMGDRDRVTDEGYIEGTSYLEFVRRTGMASTTKSDDYFTDFNLIATPPDFYLNAGKLHGEFIDAIGGFADGTRPHTCKGFNCEF